MPPPSSACMAMGKPREMSQLSVLGQFNDRNKMLPGVKCQRVHLKMQEQNSLFKEALKGVSNP